MAPAAPRRVRRGRDEGVPASLWDLPELWQGLDALGAKRTHAGPLLREAASGLLAAASAAGEKGGSWEGLGLEEAAVPEERLAALGLPRRLAALWQSTTVLSTRLAESRTSSDGSTTKLLLSLHDGHRVETVVMRHEQRTTVCVSSQVGCQMGCTFCATGTLPVVGDLGAGEIVEQLLHANCVEAAAGRPPVRNAVFMGMGEPLNNYDAVLAALRTMTDQTHLGQCALAQGRVTVSTVGVLPRMARLAADAPGACLAFSLHAPTQELREQIVPAARHTPLPALLAALDEHCARCRRPTPTSVAAMVEYVLLKDVNDSDECALQLGQLAAPRARDVMVNLIPYNPGASSASAPREFAAPKHERVERFQQIVAAHGVTTRVRREMGRDIAGACGQLALVSKGAGGGKAEEGPAAADLEDFVAWRRRQPKSAKVGTLFPRGDCLWEAAVHAEALALAAAAAADAGNDLPSRAGPVAGAAEEARPCGGAANAEEGSLGRWPAATAPVAAAAAAALAAAGLCLGLRAWAAWRGRAAAAR